MPRGRSACRSTRRSTPTAAGRGTERVQIDLKAAGRARRLPRPGRHRRRGDRELPPRRGRPARHRLRGGVRPSTPASSTARPAATARPGPRPVGRPRPQLPGRGRLPRLLRAGPGRQARRCPGATVADAAGGGMQAVMAILAALVRPRRHRRGRLPRRVRRRRRARRSCRLYIDEYLATGVVPAPGPLHPHRPLRLLRHLPLRRRPVGGGRAPSSPTSSPTCAGCSAASAGPTTSSTTTCRTRSAPTSGPPSQRKARDEWVAELAPADTCVAPGLPVPELVGRPQVAARGLIIDAVDAASRGRSASWLRCWPAPIRPPSPSAARPGRRTDTDAVLAGVPGSSTDAIAALRQEGVDRMTDRRPMTCPRSCGLIGQVQYDEAGRVPGRARLHLDPARRSRTATRCSGTTRWRPRSPAARSPRRRCSRCGSVRTTGRPGATEQAAAAAGPLRPEGRPRPARGGHERQHDRLLRAGAPGRPAAHPPDPALGQRPEDHQARAPAGSG